MKKTAILFILILALSACCRASAQEETRAVPPSVDGGEIISQEEAEKLTDALPEGAEAAMDGISPSDAAAKGEEGLEAVFDQIRENGAGIFKAALRSGAMMLTIVLLCALASSAMSDGAAKDTVSLCGTIAVSALAVDNMNSFIGLGMDTIYALSDFSKALLPALCAAAVSAGAFTSASAKYAATALFLDVLLTVGIKVIMPLIGAYLAVLIAGAALGKDSLSKVAELLKWACTVGLGLMITAFTAYLSITGIISGKADEMAARMTKSALGALLPVVGSAISEAAGTLVAGAGMVRNSIGVFGLLAVLSVCAIPFLRLGAHYLVYKGTAALSEALTDKRMGDLIGGVGSAFGMVLGFVGAAGIMLFISIISSMKAVGAL